MPVPVLYVITTLEIGGAETQLVQLLARLDRRRFDPVVCCLGHRGPLVDAIAAQQIPVEVVGFDGFCLRHPLRTAAELFRFLRVFRRARPVIVHGFLFWAYVLAAFAARLAGVPLVVASRRSLGFFKADSPGFLRAERVANRLTDVIVANAEAVRADAIRQEGLPPRKIHVIHNGVDLARYQAAPEPGAREALKIPPAARVVCVVANLIAYKGHRVLLEACAAVKAREPAFHLLLVGDGPCRGELERMAQALGLSGDVQFLGSRTDVPAILSVADVVVLPSLSEGFPNAVLEAMATGKPVIATHVGGVPEMVVEGETGLLVSPGNAEALGAAILKVLQDPERAAAMGRAGRERVREQFSLDRMVGQVQDLYEDILRQARQAGRI